MKQKRLPKGNRIEKNNYEKIDVYNYFSLFLTFK